jgi:HSP20 family protein
MALVRWDPARELDTLQGEMNRLFSSFFDTPRTAGGNGAPARRWIPAMDLVETEDHFVLKADLPGVSESDVNIELESNVLTISGERKTEHEAKKDGYYRLERSTGTFSRALTLPEGIDSGAVTASFDKGVLEVRIPKPAEAKPRRVQISVGGAEPRTIDSSE